MPLCLCVEGVWSPCVQHACGQGCRSAWGVVCWLVLQTLAGGHGNLTLSCRPGHATSRLTDMPPTAHDRLGTGAALLCTRLEVVRTP